MFILFLLYMFFFSQQKSMTLNSKFVKKKYYANFKTQNTEYGYKNMLCYCHKNML